MNIHDGDDLQIQEYGSNWKSGLNTSCQTMPGSQVGFPQRVPTQSSRQATDPPVLQATV
jgi:hypothetical protein